MPLSDSPAMIVARFLSANNYQKTLKAFIEEAGLPTNAGAESGNALTIEKVLEEKRLFDLDVQYEQHETENTSGWTTPAPSKPTVVSLPEPANILSVSVQPICLGCETPQWSLLVTTAGRRLNVFRATDAFPLLEDLSPQDSPILSWTPILDGLLSFGTAMSGQVILFDNRTKKVLCERRDHLKYVVKVATYHDPGTDKIFVATAGWDAKVLLYHIQPDLTDGSPSLSPPIASLTLPSNPEDLLFLCPTDTHPSRLVLVVTRRDSTQLHYYEVHYRTSNHSANYVSNLDLISLGSQNLAPHASLWSTFSPSSIALCPTDHMLLAIATSSVPLLKLILVRMLIPSSCSSSTLQPLSFIASPSPTTPVSPSAGDSAVTSAARAQLALQQNFAAAVMLHVSTQAPQTAYSTPKVVWRPDGSGVWVSGDDGIIRGIERSGKVITMLKGGHDGPVKVRDLWAGVVNDVDKESSGAGRQEEWLVSGGFDRRVVVWRVDKG